MRVPRRSTRARPPRGVKGRYHLYEDEWWALPYFETGSPPQKERLLFG
jgi:hypothetical protein